jgi:hypothetical protein
MRSSILPMHRFTHSEETMAGRGNALHECQIRTVISLLATTDMTIAEIAQRMGCSRKTIVGVNRRFQVRQYSGWRSSWAVSPLFAGAKNGAQLGGDGLNVQIYLLPDEARR